MAWIKVEHVTPDKPEIFSMAEALGIDADAVLGKLIRIWIWTDQHTYDGEISVVDGFLDRIAQINGFAAAMRNVGWLKDGVIPNFTNHNGSSAKTRASGQKRTADHRSKCNGSVTVTSRSTVTFTRAFRATIYERDANKCVYCGRGEGQVAPHETKRDGVMSLDHVIPATQGGDATQSNIVTCCMVCNNKKQNRTPDEAGLPWPVDALQNRYGSVTRVEQSRVGRLVGRKGKFSSLKKVETKHLDSTAAICGIHRSLSAEHPDLIAPDEDSLTAIQGAAIRALQRGNKPLEMFCGIVRHQSWENITGDQRAKAREKLRDHRSWIEQERKAGRTVPEDATPLPDKTG